MNIENTEVIDGQKLRDLIIRAVNSNPPEKGLVSPETQEMIDFAVQLRLRRELSNTSPEITAELAAEGFLM